MKILAAALVLILTLPAAAAIPAAEVEPVEPTPRVYVADVPAPAAWAAVAWQGPGLAAPVAGFWFTADTVIRTDARLQYLEQAAAQDCFDKTVAADKVVLTGGLSWLWWSLGGLAAGVVTGIVVHQRATH